MSIILDLLITSYLSFSLLFLTILNKKNIYIIIFVGLLIDFIIADTKGIITILLICLYFINRKVKSYYSRNILNYLVFILVLGLPFNISGFIIYLIFIYLINKHILKW